MSERHRRTREEMAAIGAEITESGISIAQAMEKYGASKNSILRWKRAYRESLKCDSAGGCTLIHCDSNEEWRKQRNEGLGGSDIAVLLGLSPWKTPWTLWLEKTGQVEPEDISDNPPVEWGNRLEPAIAQKFADMHPELHVEEPSYMFRRTDKPYVQASIDRFLENEYEEPGVLEIKTSSKPEDWKDGVPAYYLPQVYWYMYVIGARFAYVAVLLNGRDYREFYVERDEEEIAFIVEEAERFWTYVATRQDPPPTYSSNEAAFYAEQFPGEGDMELRAAPADEPFLEEYVEAKAVYDNARTRYNEAAAQLKFRMGDRGVKSYISPLGRFTWSRYTATRVNTKRLYKENPELKEKYTEEYTRDGGIRFKEAR